MVNDIKLKKVALHHSRLHYQPHWTAVSCDQICVTTLSSYTNYKLCSQPPRKHWAILKKKHVDMWLEDMDVLAPVQWCGMTYCARSNMWVNWCSLQYACGCCSHSSHISESSLSWINISSSSRLMVFDGKSGKFFSSCANSLPSKSESPL